MHTREFCNSLAGVFVHCNSCVCVQAPMKKVAAPMHKAEAAPKRKAAKMEGPAKKAKKAMPKKMAAKK